MLRKIVPNIGISPEERKFRKILENSFIEQAGDDQALSVLHFDAGNAAPHLQTRDAVNCHTLIDFADLREHPQVDCVRPGYGREKIEPDAEGLELDLKGLHRALNHGELASGQKPPRPAVFNHKIGLGENLRNVPVLKQAIEGK